MCPRQAIGDTSTAGFGLSYNSAGHRGYGDAAEEIHTHLGALC